MANQKPYFHLSTINDYRENDPNRFKSRRYDKPAPILVDHAEEWEAEHRLGYGHLNHRHQLLVQYKGNERADDTWEPIANLDHTPHLITTILGH